MQYSQHCIDTSCQYILNCKYALFDLNLSVFEVGEVLSVELANTKCKLEKVTEQATSLEQTKQIAFQQHDLYEQEIKTLETQVENMRRVQIFTIFFFNFFFLTFNI